MSFPTKVEVVRRSNAAKVQKLGAYAPRFHSRSKMSIKSDRWIRKTAHEHDMINPFSEKQVSQGVISYGVSSYGYDLRVADEFKIFTNVKSKIVDPKNFAESRFGR